MKNFKSICKVFMNMNTFAMYSNTNTNTLQFLQKYSSTNTFKNVFEYEYFLPRPVSIVRDL